MNLEPAPRLSKTTFILIDAGLLVTAFIIVFFARNPYAPLPFVSAVLCIVLSAIIILIPLLRDLAANIADDTKVERERLAEQVQRLHAAGESLARAAAQIKAVEEAVHKTAHSAENLPYRMQEKLAEFNEALAEKESDEREALERELDELRAANSDQLKAVAEKVGKATTDWAALEVATRKQFAATQETVAKLEEKLRATLAQVDARIADLGRAAAAVPRVVTEVVPVAPNEPSHPAPGPAAPVEAPVIESVTLSESAAPAEDPKPKKPRSPRKPRPEDSLAAMSEPAPSTDASEASAGVRPESPVDPAPASSSESPVAASAAEAATSSDGATRLLATAYIGIGNKLFIRGDGPGLSWDKGVPMQFVSIGKWGWASHDVTAPVRVKLYKNDETAAVSGEVTVEPGKHVEVTALF